MFDKLMRVKEVNEIPKGEASNYVFVLNDLF